MIPKTTALGGSLSNSVPNTGQIWPPVTLASLLTLNFSQESEDQQSLCRISPVLPSQPGSPSLLCIYLPNSRDSSLLPPSPNGTSVVVQPLSFVQLFSTLWPATCQASLSFTVFGSLLKFMSIESVILSNHLILYHFLLLLPSVFTNESALCIRWPNYGSFSISLSNEYSGLISFRIDWIDLLAVQGTLKSLLQYHSRKASVLQHSAFFTVQLSHPYMTTGKILASPIQRFVDKVMSLLF